MIGKRIREIRKNFKMTQEEFGRRLGVGMHAVTSYELGRVEPKELFIKHLCKEFNVNEEWMYNGTGDPYKTLSSKEEKLLEIVTDICMDDRTEVRDAMLNLAKLNESQLNAVLQVMEEMLKGTPIN